MMIPKFRAWDKVTNQMRACYGFNDMEREVYVCNVADDEFKGQLRTVHAIKRKFDDVILMQSTGLKDKNGVEIYEGDILGRQFYVNAIVSYDDGAFEQGWNCYRKHRLDQDFCSSREVIGNIYENPEILGDESDSD